MEVEWKIKSSLKEYKWMIDVDEKVVSQIVKQAHSLIEEGGASTYMETFKCSICLQLVYWPVSCQNCD